MVPNARFPEVWGGVECSINRIQNIFVNQLSRRPDILSRESLEQFASLGIKAMRYPVLWEAVAPDHPEQYNWTSVDEGLAELQRLGVRPIIGLLHHGSGPRYTDLLDPQFSDKLAAFARAVAERFPWVKDYTPVNEPLTTARFSGLYGLWFPHHQSDQSFLRMFIHETRATALAMEQIRTVNPEARLVQTEDMGKTWSAPQLQYQADFENERRWLSFDALFGRLNPSHPLWDWMISTGLERELLDELAETSCPPDVLGIDYYMTSERYLDERTFLFPEQAAGGNGRHVYVDIEAVRYECGGPAGAGEILREVWQRYKTPVAITECHLGCSREEQMRWLLDVWKSAVSLRDSGADVRAVTAWSMAGAFDWDSLLTIDAGHYESGVYDSRYSEGLRPTALAEVVRSIATTGDYQHPVTDSPGWWKRPERLAYGTLLKHGLSGDSRKSKPGFRPLLITGGTGTLGSAFRRICKQRAIDFVSPARSQLDIGNREQVRAVLEQLKPWGVINTAGFVRVDDAEVEYDSCYRINRDGAVHLAEICCQLGIPYLTFSSDLVFDGLKQSPYDEEDSPNPLQVYGLSKLAMEQMVAEQCPTAMIVRTSAFFGPWDSYNFAYHTVRDLQSGRVHLAPSDTVVTATYVPDLVSTALDLFIDGEYGIWHLANEGEASWYELSGMLAHTLDLDRHLVEPCSIRDLALPAERPAYSALTSSKATLLPNLESAISRYCTEATLPLPAAMQMV